MGRGGGPNHPEKSQNKGFLSNSGPDLLKNYQATKPAFNVLGLSRYIDTSILIDTYLADTVSIRLGAVSRYFQKFY